MAFLARFRQALARSRLMLAFCPRSQFVPCPAIKGRTPPPTGRTSHRGLLALVAVVCWQSASLAQAQLPVTQLFAVSPSGGQQGTTVQVTLAATANGEGIERRRRRKRQQAPAIDVALDGLVFSHPGITAVQKMSDPQPFQKSPDPVPMTFLVTIAPDVPPGVYDVRAAGPFGASNPRSFVVSDRKEIAETPGNNTRATAQAIEIESVVNGLVDGSAIDWYKFSAKQGQRLIVDCWAERIDSRMDGSLVLLDSTGREVARDRDTNGREPLLDYSVPADGEYFLQVFDYEYRGGAEFFYRLSIGTGPYIDFVLPPAGMPGVRGEHVVYGRNLPGGAPAEGVKVNGRPLEKLAVGIDFPAAPTPLSRLGAGQARLDAVLLEGFEFRLPSPQGVSNPFVLSTAAAPAVLEIEPNDDPANPQRLVAPCEYAGTFGARRDRDYVAFEAKAGQVFWIEMYSQRLGNATDPHVLVQRVTKDDKGQDQASDVVDADDTPLLPNPTNGDPLVRFQAPADGVYRLLIEDQHSRSQPDARAIYRLAIRAENPDFRLAVNTAFPAVGRAESRPWNALLRRGANEPFDVFVLRTDNFAGEVKVSAEGLPQGVTAKEITIAPGQSTGVLVLSSEEGAEPFLGTIRIVGKAKIGERDVMHEAVATSVRFAAPPNTPVKGRLAREVVLAVSESETGPFVVAAGGDQPLEMSRGGKLLIPVKLARRNEIKGNVTFTPLDLPPNTAADALAFDPNTNEGNLGLQINAAAAPGVYTISLQSQATISYRYDVQGADLAAAAKTEHEALLATLTTASQQADAAKQAADAAATQAATEAQAATDKAAQAKTAADGDANNADLKKASDEAAAAAATAAEKSKAATDAKAAADKAAADAAAMLKAATDYKAVVDKRAADTAAASQPKDLAIVQASTPITFTIVPTPIKLTPGQQPAFKQGTKIELPIAIERKYGFAEAVQVEVIIPGSATGLSSATISIPAGQNEGKLTFEAGAEAAIGAHAITLRTTVNFNGQGVQFEQTAPLTVESK